MNDPRLPTEPNEIEIIKNYFVKLRDINSDNLEVIPIGKKPLFLIQLLRDGYSMLMAGNDGLISRVAETLQLPIDQALEILNSNESDELSLHLKNRLCRAIVAEFDFMHATIYGELIEEEESRVEILGSQERNLFKVSCNDGNILWGNSFREFGIDKIMGDKENGEFVVGVRQAFFTVDRVNGEPIFVSIGNNIPNFEMKE